MKVLQFPLARITIGFIVGILTTFCLKPNPTIIFGLLFTFLLFIGISYFLKIQKFQKNFLFAILTYFLSFFIGSTALIIHTDSYQKNNYSNDNTIFEKPELITLVIREKLKSSTFNKRYIALIRSISTKKYGGKIILSTPIDSLNLTFEPGTILQIKSSLYKNKAPNNPNQFDYGTYLSNKQIYAQLYADKSQIKIGSEFEKDIWYYISKLRTRIIHNLEKSNFNKTELNVALALILGQKQDISPEIIHDYQYAGAVHILSVSGLHVGFLLLFIKFLLKPVPNTKKGSFIKLITTIMSLFLFALIAGLSPSIVRSATMFSFVAIGLHLRRSVNIYHTLLVSILLILLFEPSFLFDVGFQLSYVALFFIVWFQPVLVSLFNPKNKVLKYIWDILTVSFAAQIGTLPLSLFYFHQFPGLFFLTNLAIIPLLSFTMILGIIVMLLAAFGLTPYFLVKSLEWSIFCLNKIINTIASFEQFIIKDISFNFYLLFGSYLLIIAFIIWLQKPNFSKLVLVLFSIIILQSTVIVNKWNIQNQEEWIVFNSKRNTIITKRHGEHIQLVSNDSFLKNSTNKRAVSSYLVENFSTIKSKEMIRHTDFFKGNKILILDSLGNYTKDTKPDILLLTQSPKINLDRLLQNLKPKLVIADASNYNTIQKYWKASCEKQKIPFHATAEKGFYKIN
jgi:competence protein ComEC